MSEAGPSPGPRAARWAALLVLAVLLATVDTRAFGLIPDGKEMLSASAAISRFLEIGVSRDFVNAPRRPGGDAVSRYGMGLSLAEALPGALVRVVRAAAPSAPSAPVFVLVPIACLVAAAWATARALLLLGAAPAWAAASGAGLVLATPLFGYAASDYGEPLQACCIALVLLAVVELRDAPVSRRWQIVAGVAAGFAVLTKTLLLVAVAPILACALWGKREEERFLEGERGEEKRQGRETRVERREEQRAERARSRRAGATDARRRALPWPLLFSFAGILSLWVLLEFARFGKLFGGYAGETFSYPFFTGLLRLTVFPNKGLFWYAPIVLLAPLGFVPLFRRDARLALASALSFVVLLFAASAWWAWDGQAGWGPRLLLPALPPLVFLAGFACASSSGRPVRIAGALALFLGFGVNLLSALVPFPAVYALSSVVPPQPIAEARAEGTAYEVGRGADGILRATAPHHLSLTPGWSPIRVHALVLAAKLRGEAAERLGREGLSSLDPPFRPALPEEPAPAMLLALRPVRAGWGREFFVESGERLSDPWVEATRDQTVRAIDVKDFARAAALGEDLLRKKGRDPDSDSASDPRVVALIAESIRLGGGQDAGAQSSDSRAAASLSFLSKQISSLHSSSNSLTCNPWILFVRAMAEPPGDLSCIPEASREGFARSLDASRRQGWTLTSWVRALRTGAP
ncbi:MAG: hypothetical protein NEA02_07115 [Thermoanaerobaculia bacterium]|nr:hypothetical protein [Thermoanaerobaculia bacterium]